MKLYLLTLHEYLQDWECNCSILIRAENEENARKIALDAGGLEAYYSPTCWTEDKFSSCEEITVKGIEEVIIIDNKGSWFLK